MSVDPRELLNVLKQIVAISDRRHNLWDRAKSLIAEAEDGAQTKLSPGVSAWGEEWMANRRAATSPAGDPSSGLIGQPYNPDDERFARLLDSQWRAGHKSGWNECFANYVEPNRSTAQALRHQSTGVTGITDEMVERAAKAMLSAHDFSPSGWDSLTPEWQKVYCDMARAALSAQERG